ncbi:hypothetical protein Q5O24_02925 [Eubacteriaceae bacterium ES3]|nr:hypothetical protein Q5O24_02925 [Eubacteriaceae bacterium ES3]
MITIFGLAEIVARPFTRSKRLVIRYLIDLIVGHVYIVNMMFLLGYINLISRSAVIIALLLVAILIRYMIEPKRINAYWLEKFRVLTQIFAREYGVRLVVRNTRRTFDLNIRAKLKNITIKNLIEGIFVAGVLGIQIYYASYQTLNFISYGAPDVEVHLYWIQSLVGGKLFPAGVYPFGMHCIGAALSLIYDIPAVIIARMLGVVASTFIMLNCYIFISEICKLRYVAAVAMIFYLLGNYGTFSTYSRFQYMITQEYAMLFLYPMAIFLYRYLKKKRRADLFYFGMAFSLTLSIHFYVTAIALFLCLAVGMVFIIHIIKNKLLLSLLITGILSTFIAILPLGVGLLVGYELEQSFQYGAAVVTNDMGLYGGEEEEKNDLTLEKPYKINEIGEKVKQILLSYLVTTKQYFLFYLIPMAVIFISGTIRLVINAFNKRSDFDSLRSISILVFALLLFAHEFAIIFDLPVILDAQRNAIFLAYLSPVLLALSTDSIYQCFSEVRWLSRSVNIIMGLSPVLLVFLIIQFEFVKDHGYIYYFQTKGAMAVMEDIIHNYDQYMWTVVSPVNETSIVYNNGYHYELVEFLFEQEDYDEDTEIFIPTPNVFFIIEKLPIDRYGYGFTADEIRELDREPVSFDLMMEDITGEAKLDDYYHEQRAKLMSRIYYWAQVYQVLFPDEMTVYYEDKEIIVYRLRQNAYALNNLSIDYKNLAREESENE